MDIADDTDNEVTMMVIWLWSVFEHVKPSLCVSYERIRVFAGGKIQEDFRFLHVDVVWSSI